MNTSVPTYEQESTFKRDLAHLSEDEKRRFYAAVKKMAHDLKTGQGFCESLRVKGVQRLPGVFEMTWADDGRALFRYGTSPNAGDVHIIWMRVGSHDILEECRARASCPRSWVFYRASRSARATKVRTGTPLAPLSA